MENVRIAVLDTYDQVLCHMDNSAPGALHYYDDELHMYLKGSAHTFGFKVSADHEDSEHITVGHKLAFVYNGKDYYLNIIKAFESETEIEVTAFSLSFELLNDSPEEYEATAAMTFEEYMEIFDTEKCVDIGLNELPSSSKRMGKFKEETLLSRIFSLAELFEVEAEFIPVLNNNYSLKKVVLNIYREHSSKYQGIGKNRTDIVLRYGKGVTGIRKSLDISELFTAIRPYGKDGLTLESLRDMQVKDAAGNIEFEHLEGEKEIRAVQARGIFPSNLISKDRYITITREYETNDQLVLYQDALNDLKDGCVPKATYEIEGYFDTGIGDTISVEDSEFNPPLYLTARVTEQIVSFTDMKRNKSVFSNIKEEKSQISQTMIKKMQEMIEESFVARTQKRGTSIFSAQITGSDMLCWIPKTVIIGEETPNVGDYLLTKNGYLFNVLNVDGDGMSVRRVSNIGSPVGAKASRFFFTSETADYTWDRLNYGKLFPNTVTPNISDAILCTNGALFEISSFVSSDPTADPIVNYIANIGTKGVETRGFSIFYCGSESQGVDTEYVYAYHVTGGSALQKGDLILTANGMLYIVESITSYYVYVTYIQTLYA